MAPTQARTMREDPVPAADPAGRNSGLHPWSRLTRVRPHRRRCRCGPLARRSCDAPAMAVDAMRFLAFERRRLVVRTGDGAPALATLELASLELAGATAEAVPHFPLGLPEAPQLRVADLPADAQLPAGTELRELRSLLAALAERDARLAVRALHVL